MAERPSEIRHDPATAQPPPLPSAAYPPDASSAEIERDIHRTRAEMDETVDAIGERLRPRHLLDEVIDFFRHTSAGRSTAEGAKDTADSAKESLKSAGSTAWAKLKEHPVPAALIGAGLTWILVDEGTSHADGGGRHGDAARRVPGHWRDLPEHSGSFVDARTGQPYDEATYGAEFRSAGGGGAAGARGTMAGVTDKAREMAGRAGDMASGATGTASEWAGATRDKASAYGHSAIEAGRSMQHAMQRGYRTTRESFTEALDAYPLAVGAAALAAGVIAGLILPGTRREDELMGEQSDRLKRQAKDVGEEVVERGADVASATASAAAGEAERQGLSPGALADKARHVASDAKESARREGLDPQSLKHKAQDVAERAKETAKGEASRQNEEMKREQQG